MSALSEFIFQNTIKGFLDDEEGDALHHYAGGIAKVGPALEVGSYCGKSTVYIGEACRRSGNTLYALDHHRGSEEHQLGEAYHDPDLFDQNEQMVDSFPLFRRTLRLAELEETVVPVVAKSEVVARHWATPLGFVFIDGGHSPENALKDCLLWSANVAVGGVFAVHDLFEHPHEGGQGPYLAFQKILESGHFEKIDQVKSLGFLRKMGT